ncbi:hypothetical protein HK104_002869 [Borealophlyctis nickersoniae]|nr:hypothetical protein HK104_002869 [Borealophlyctis nickersoniae]
MKVMEDAEAEAQVFEDKKRAPFQSRTETYLRIVGSNPALVERVTTKWGEVMTVVNQAKELRDADFAQLNECSESGEEGFTRYLNALRSGISWLSEAESVETSLNEASTSITEIRDKLHAVSETMIQVEDHMDDSIPQTIHDIEEQMWRLDHHLTTTLSTQLTSLQTHRVDPDEIAMPATTIAARADLFTSHLTRLTQMYPTLTHRLASLRPTLVLTRTLQDFTSEACYTLSNLHTRLAVEEGLDIPHGLDPTADERTYSDILQGVNEREGRARAWQEVMRRAKVEECAEKYCALVGSGDVPGGDTRVVDAVRDKVSQVKRVESRIAQVVKRNKDAVALGMRVVKDVKYLGSQIMKQVGDVDADIDRAKGLGTPFEIITAARGIQDRVRDLEGAAQDVSINAHGVDDARVKTFVQSLHTAVSARRQKVESLGSDTVTSLLDEWETRFARPAQAWCDDVAAKIRVPAVERPRSGEDAGASASAVVYAVEARHSGLARDVEAFEPTMKEFEVATEGAVKALREWGSKRESTVGGEEVSAASSFARNPETLQAGYVSIRARFEELKRVVKDGTECARQGAKLLEEIAAARQTVKSVEDGIAQSAAGGDASETRLNELEERLSQLERTAINDALGAALDEMNSLPAATSVSHDHTLIAQACGRRFESLLDDAQRVRSLLVGTKRTKSVVDDYLKQAEEVVAWVAARLENLESVEQDAKKEAKRVIELEPDPDDPANAVPEEVIDGAVFEAAERSAEREAALAGAEAALERYGRAYENIAAYADRVVKTCGDNPAAADGVRKQQKEVVERWEEMHERLHSIRDRVQRQSKIFLWAKRCRVEVEVGIEAGRKKLAAGDLLNGLGDPNGEEFTLMSLVEKVEDVIKSREVEIKHAEEDVEAIGEAAALIVRTMDAEAKSQGADYDFAGAIQDRDVLDFLVKRGQSRVARRLAAYQQLFDEQRTALRALARTISGFHLVAEDVEPWLDEAVRGLRERLHRKLSDDVDDEGNAIIAPHQHLVITGDDAVDEKNLTEWSRVYVGIDEKLRTEIAEQVEEAATLAGQMEVECMVFGRAALRSLRESVREQVERMKERCREAGRLVNEEKLGIERAATYSEWHKVLSHLETEVEALATRLNNATSNPAELNEDLFAETEGGLAAHDRALDAFVRTTEEDKRSSFLRPPSSSVPPPPGAEDFGATKLRRRRSVVATVHMSNLAEQANAAALRKRHEALAARLMDYRTTVEELREAHENRKKKESIDEMIEKARVWCVACVDEVRERCRKLPPKQLLRRDIDFRETVPASPGKDANGVDLQDVLRDAIRIHTSTTFELMQHRTTVDGIDSQVSDDRLTEVRSLLSKIEMQVVSEKQRIDDTKRLFSHDRAAMNILGWMGAARGAANALVDAQRQALASEEEEEGALEDLVATFEEVAELEDRLKVFESTVNGFMDLADTARREVASVVDGGQDDALIVEAFHAAVLGKTERVKTEWRSLSEVVQGLRGSSVDRARELEFTGTVDEIHRNFDEAKEALNALSRGEADDAERVYHEVEFLLDEKVLPLVLALREKAVTAARSPAEKNRYLQQQRALHDRLQSLFEFVESRRLNADTGTLQRRFARLANEVEDMYNDYSRFVQDASAAATAASAAAAGIALPAGGRAPPTDAECEALAQQLDRRFAYYDIKIRSVIGRMETAGKRIGGGPKQRELTAKWEAARVWTEGVKDELLHRVRARKLVKKKSGLPTSSHMRRPSQGSGLSFIARPTQASRLYQPSTPTKPPPPSYMERTPSYRDRSPSSSNRTPSPALSSRSSPTSTTSSTGHTPRIPTGPVRVYLPSPNNYIPNPRDALDVQIARIVNQHPSSIKIERTGEPGRYWFGEALPRLCFCRLLRDHAVMVRVGGGWQALAEFLTEHSTLEHRIPTIRSFAPEDGEDKAPPPAGSQMIELEPGGNVNPYALASKLPRKFASAIARAARRD